MIIIDVLIVIVIVIYIYIYGNLPVALSHPRKHVSHYGSSDFC